MPRTLHLLASSHRELDPTEGVKTGRGVPRRSDRAVSFRRQKAAVGEPPRGSKTKVIHWPARLRVVTWLDPRERSAVALALPERIVLVHHDTLSAVRAAVVQGEADAALVSVALLRAEDVASVAGLVRRYPGTLVVGYAGDINDPSTLTGVLLLGQAGVRVLVDGRAPKGGPALRSVFEVRRTTEAFMQAALHEIMRVLATGAPEGAQPYAPGVARFLAGVFQPQMRTSTELAAALGVRPGTLLTRFTRAHLPSPKQYVTWAHFVRAAHFAEMPNRSIGDVAYAVGASSPQAFARTLRTVLGITPTAFRATYTGETMLARFRALLIEPHLPTLREFDPVRDAAIAEVRGVIENEDASGQGGSGSLKRVG